jgi:hypothetical protein
MKKILSLLAAGLMVSALIIGCGTEDPWSPDPTRPLDLAMVSGPADTVAYASDVSFSWTSTGGVGEVLYQYRLDSGSWSTASNATSVIYENVITGATFGVRATDEDGNTDEETRQFWVGTQPADDTTPPTVWITSSPAEGGYIATGSTISFTWDGEDDADLDNVLFWYSFAGTTSDTSATRTVTFVNVAAADPATFSVWAIDQSGNPSTAATISFVIKDATILYVDDFLWVGDPAKERDQKQFYRDALEGYAFAEWDIELQGMPDSAYVLNFSTIVWASDSYLGDAAATWWFEVGEPGESSLHYFMENEGHLLAAGANILQMIYNSNPPAPGDFEYDWLGLNDTDGWDYWGDFTWAISAGNYAGLPDSMKIDVGKNGDQTDIAEDIFGFRDSTVILYTKGLDIDGEEPYDYGESVGHIFYPGGGGARSAMLNFDAYSMPIDGIKATFQAILTEFGE